MCQRDNHIASVRLQLAAKLPALVHKVNVHHVLVHVDARDGHQPLLLHQTDYSKSMTAPLHLDVLFRVRQLPARPLVEHVGQQPREAKLLHPQHQLLAAKIKVMIPEAPHVHADVVEHGGHVRSLGEGREGRRVEAIAGEEDQRVALDVLHGFAEARRPADRLLVVGRDLIDVRKVYDGQRLGCVDRGGARCQTCRPHGTPSSPRASPSYR
mmetsp:Transcript_5643/g.15886  ORF Transcript_5643/g.15886 Transcript_5643/m.15886 type:complete len:211 (+) Transcript_5643:1197-1829(+)